MSKPKDWMPKIGETVALDDLYEIDGMRFLVENVRFDKNKFGEGTLIYMTPEIDDKYVSLVRSGRDISQVRKLYGD